MGDNLAGLSLAICGCVRRDYHRKPLWLVIFPRPALQGGEFGKTRLAGWPSIC
jgi:hypothetical protein